jgi:hypothetical protein
MGDVRAAAGLGLQNSTRPFPAVSTMALTAFCLLLPEMHLSPVLVSAGRLPDPDPSGVDDSGFPCHSEVVDDLRSPMARVLVERSTPNQHASTS